jgi:nucleoside-diphosphate-sugar epimerase
MRVFVTGASSNFAQALLPALCADAAIENVTGIDSRGPRFEHPKFSAAALDIRDLGVPPMLAGHDALVHLASAGPRGMSTSDMFDLNVRSAHKLFHAARGAGVKRLVHMSSALVYGPAVHANEQSALKPLPGFTYAEHQAQLEQMLGIEFPECVRLRPHVIVGPHAHRVLKKVLRQPFYLRFPEAQPLLQCVHEDDVAQAVLLSLEKPARGPYNLAVEESLALRDAIRARYGFAIGVTPATARAALERASRLFHWDFDAAWLDRLSHTLLVNSRRAIIELGWRARYSARDALRAT